MTPAMIAALRRLAVALETVADPDVADAAAAVRDAIDRAKGSHTTDLTSGRRLSELPAEVSTE